MSINSYCTVVINQDSHSKLIFHDELSRSFVFEGQVFEAIEGDNSWLGFYDWLRLASGEVVGLRIRFDEARNVDLIHPYVGNRLILDSDLAVIRFTLEGVPIEKISGDADFSGNEIFRGNDGAIAITFYAPKFVTSESHVQLDAG